MEVHQEAIAVASVATAHHAAVPCLGTSGPRQVDMEPRGRQRQSTAPHLVVVYEAGPGGDGRARELTKPGQRCGVVAPSRMPNKPGDRVQTDRRDAGPLARLRRSGALPPGDGPPGAADAIGDLRRARDEAVRDRQAAQGRRTAVWRRHAIRDTGAAHGGPAPRRWRAAGVCPTPAPQLVVQAYVGAVTDHTARLGRRAPALHEPVPAWRGPPGVDALQARRGVQGTGAVTPVAALGDRTRVDTPRPWMRCLGLLPAAYSSGERRRPGSRTHAGNTPARRARVAGAWASRAPATVRRHRPLRRDAPPQASPDSRGQAHGRRCTRVRGLMACGTKAPPVVGAIARALVGWMGAMATQGPVTRYV